MNCKHQLPFIECDVCHDPERDYGDYGLAKQYYGIRQCKCTLGQEGDIVHYTDAFELPHPMVRIPEYLDGMGDIIRDEKSDLRTSVLCLWIALTELVEYIKERDDGRNNRSPRTET